MAGPLANLGVLVDEDVEGPLKSARTLRRIQATARRPTTGVKPMALTEMASEGASRPT
jgi:hypothetical protein